MRRNALRVDCHLVAGFVRPFNCNVLFRPLWKWLKIIKSQLSIERWLIIAIALASTNKIRLGSIHAIYYLLALIILDCPFITFHFLRLCPLGKFVRSSASISIDVVTSLLKLRARSVCSEICAGAVGRKRPILRGSIPWFEIRFVCQNLQPKLYLIHLLNEEDIFGVMRNVRFFTDCNEQQPPDVLD
jgi:hypothetical protein